jgi:hypothetical protein
MNAAMMLVCLAGSMTAAQKGDVVFKAPLIQVKRDYSRDNKPYLYALYNRVYMGRYYEKPKDAKDLGKPEADSSRLPTTYFHDKSPIGVVLQKYNWFPGKDNTYHADARLPASLIAAAALDPCGQLTNLWSEPPIAVLGMDVGTLAAYARPTQTMHFIERVPTFVKLSLPAKGEKRIFHYVQDALDRCANLKVFEGEPRAMIEKHGGENFYQVIVVETYKLPVSAVHKELMTKEAIQMLMSKVREDGIVCYHTSNRYYDLAPIIASAAKELSYACVVGNDAADFNPDVRNDHRFSSEWVMVARNAKHLAHLKAPPDYNKEARFGRSAFWSHPDVTHSSLVWTDKGEQSFRGVYRSDPEIDKLYDVVSDAQEFLRHSAGVSYTTSYRFTDPIRRVIGAWSRTSAESKNRSTPTAAQRRRANYESRVVLFEAPRIKVLNEYRDDQEYLFLMYNGTYLGRNYQEPKDKKAHGDPDKDISRMPTTYFHDKSPVGVVLQKYNWFPGKVNTYHADARLPSSLLGMGLDPLSQLAHLWSEPPIAVIGMDVGTMAAYARPTQTMHFFERLPEFVKLSFPVKGEQPFFHYVQDSLGRGANVKIFEGEPRPAIEKHGGEGFYQLIVFSTYKLAITTVHKELMTKEGMQLLMSKTRDNGILCLHTSNRYYDLVPIVASTAKELGYACVVGDDSASWKEDRRRDRFNSQWVMIARKAEHLHGLNEPKDYDKTERWKLDPFWAPAGHTNKKFVWTDKGKKSLRGFYVYDPTIQEFSRWLSAREWDFTESTGLAISPYTRGVYGLLGQWSRQRAEALNRETSNEKN